MPRNSNVTLPQEQRDHANRLMKAVGVEQARRFLKVNRHTLERAAGGLTIQLATRDALIERLAQRTEDGKNP